jgi:hypothetical protein
MFLMTSRTYVSHPAVAAHEELGGSPDVADRIAFAVAWDGAEPPAQQRQVRQRVGRKKFASRIYSACVGVDGCGEPDAITAQP